MVVKGDETIGRGAANPARILGVKEEVRTAEIARMRLPGIAELWSETLGDDRICVALLDGPVDRSHASLNRANLTVLDGPAPGDADDGPACRHGTHVASILFGRHDGPVPGLAPRCRGVVVPIFESADDGTFRPCSQLDLARAITTAALAGAHVINVSGGQFAPAGAAHPFLADVVRDCARRNILIVAAVGNQGCECPHVPAALDAVLAVGAMDARGEPLPSSNWARPYQSQGLLAPGQDVPGARAGGGSAWGTGTSYATAVVSGVAALLLSLQRKWGRRPDPRLVRQALLAGARGRGSTPAADCRRLLAGRLQVPGAVSFLSERRCTMIEPSRAEAVNSSPDQGELERDTADNSPATSRVATQTCSRVPARGPEAVLEAVRPQPAREPEPAPTACSCQKGAPTQFVYAFGQIGYDFPGEARLDSIVQRMAALAGISPPQRGLAYEAGRMLDYLEKNPWDAAAVEWTLNLDGTALYAVRPQGPFAADAYKQLRQFLRDQVTEGAERVSVPGVLAGQARLLNGQAVPVIVPDLRGMYSWTTAGLVEAVLGREPPATGPDRDGYADKRAGVRNFLDRVYHEARNLGLTPQDRALNFAATNVFEMGAVFASALKEKMDVDRIDVVPSPLGRPGSDCWDVEVYFFYPERQVQTVRKVYRFTVDVSDTVPVTVGAMRSWFAR